MKKVNVNIKDQTVEIFSEDKQNWEKCNFEEAGINNEDEGEITEHLKDRFGEIEINFI